MEQQRLAQQIFGFYKMTHDSTIVSIDSIQDQTKKLINFSLDQAPWLPQQARNIIKVWTETYLKGLDGIKAAADAQYRKYETTFNPE